MGSGQKAKARWSLYSMQSGENFHPEILGDLLKNFEQESDMIRIAF